MKMMAIRILRECLVGGESRPAKSELEVDEKTARLLVGMGRAEIVGEAPEKETQDPNPLNTDDPGKGGGSGVGSKKKGK